MAENDFQKKFNKGLSTGNDDGQGFLDKAKSAFGMADSPEQKMDAMKRKLAQPTPTPSE